MSRRALALSGPALRLIGPACVVLLVLAGCQARTSPDSVTPPTATRTADVATPAARYPSLPPAGIPPVVGDGALAILPSGIGGDMLPVTADLSSGWLATALVPTDPTRSVAVRMQALPAEAFEPVPPSGTALLLTVDLFDAESGQRLPAAPAPPAVGIRPPPGLDTSTLALWQLDTPSGGYQPLISSPGESRGVLSAWLPNRGSVVIAIAMPSPGDSALSAQQPSAQPARTAPATPSDDGARRRADPTATAVAPRAPLPSRVMIPAIGVDAPITPVGLEASGIMAGPTEGHVVGWYELGARPGERSNAILAGHVDLHQQLGAFFHLRELAPGATIDVDTGLGIAYRYVVSDVQTYRATDAPLAEIFGPTAAPTLTLITCGGQFDPVSRAYLDRVVVRAHGS